MKRSFRAVLAGLVFAAAAMPFTAAPAPAETTTTDAPKLRFERLELTDGRRLKNVVVKTFNRANETLLVLADGKAMTIPLAAIPAPLQPQLRAAPDSGSTVSTFSVPPPANAPASVAPGGKQPVAQPTRPAPAVRPESGAPTRPGKQPTTNQLLAAQAGDSVAAHKNAALKRAQSYYRFEFRLGTEAGAVTGLEFDTTAPKPVAGWPGRYRTEGKAYLEFYDSRGRSFQRRTSTFEVVTEQKPGDDDLVVVDFTPKS